MELDDLRLRVVAPAEPVPARFAERTKITARWLWAQRPDCRYLRRYEVTCANTLGDRFRYRFSVRRR